MSTFKHPQYRPDEQPVDLDTSAVRDTAERAIRQRLGEQYVADYGTQGCLRNVQALGRMKALVHLNSGGNALAVRAALEREGYAVSHGPRSDHEVALIVTAGNACRKSVVR